MKKVKQLRDVRIAVTILALLIILAAANVATSAGIINNLSEDVASLTIGQVDQAEALHRKFERCAFFLSITVNHDDLEDAEECLVELTVAIGGDDGEDVEIAKSRLLSALSQIRRLSGAGIDSII